MVGVGARERQSRERPGGASGRGRNERRWEGQGKDSGRLGRARERHRAVLLRPPSSRAPRSGATKAHVRSSVRNSTVAVHMCATFVRIALPSCRVGCSAMHPSRLFRMTGGGRESPPRVRRTPRGSRQQRQRRSGRFWRSVRRGYCGGG